MKNRIFVLLVLLCVVCDYSIANNLKTARSLYLDGKYEEALPLFEKEYKKKKKDGSINHWLGVCLYETGNYKEAENYLKYADTRKVVESSHYLAKIYFKNYDFDQIEGKDLKPKPKQLSIFDGEDFIYDDMYNENEEKTNPGYEYEPKKFGAK